MTLILAGILLIAIGFAHSYLGERYILIRLFKRDNLPKLFGGTEFTINTLRFAWHLTSVAWFGFAAILLSFATGQFDINLVTDIIAITFIIHGLAALFGSKGKHLSWPIFLLIGILCLMQRFV